MEKTIGIGGPGIGVGLDITLRIERLRSTVDELTSTLRQTGEMTTGTVTNLVKKLKDEGVGELKRALQEGKETVEGSKVYNQIVSALQSAASRGEAEARNLLHELGEKVEASGQKMQEAASKEHDVRH